VYGAPPYSFTAEQLRWGFEYRDLLVMDHARGERLRDD